MIPYTIGFDLGGTRLKSGGVTEQGKLLAQGVAPRAPTWGRMYCCSRWSLKWNEYRDRQSRGPFPSVWLCQAASTPTLPGELDGLEGYPLVPKLQKAVGIPLFKA